MAHPASVAASTRSGRSQKARRWSLATTPPPVTTTSAHNRPRTKWIMTAGSLARRQESQVGWQAIRLPLVDYFYQSAKNLTRPQAAPTRLLVQGLRWLH